MLRLLVPLAIVGTLASCQRTTDTTEPPKVLIQQTSYSDIASVPIFEPARPARSDVELVLDAVIRDILTNPYLDDIREFYGTPGDRRLALRADAELPWPPGYQPQIEGYEVFYRASNQADPREPRLLGLELYHFEFPPTGVKHPLYHHPIAVGVFNMGGIANDGPTGGGCLVYYSVERRGDAWVVKYKWALDP